MLQIGTLVDGRYKIIKLLGRGGTSCVFLAENIRIKNYWAIKEVYKGGVGGVSAKGGKLIAESRILTKLRHPGLPTIVDVIETYQSYLIVMEYIEGISLDKLLQQRGAQQEHMVREWGMQLCDVLQYLHSQNPPIIYRDMKPANIMLKPDGKVVLVDFGMAREFKYRNSHDTDALGTHGYAAPEQYGDKCQTDARTDVYGLGVTLYQLLTGQDPCVPPYGIQPIYKYNSSASQNMEQIICKCMELKMEMRYQTVDELKRCLESGKIQPNTFDEEETKRGKGFVWLAIVIPTVFIILIAIAVVLALKPPRNTFYDEAYRYEEPENEADMPWLEQEVCIEYPEEIVELEFTSYTSGMYSFYACSETGAVVAWLYDEGYNLVASDNLYGEYSDFYISAWLEEGETYYLQTTLYYLEPELPATGSYIVEAAME